MIPIDRSDIQHDNYKTNIGSNVISYFSKQRLLFFNPALCPFFCLVIRLTGMCSEECFPKYFRPTACNNSFICGHQGARCATSLHQLPAMTPATSAGSTAEPATSSAPTSDQKKRARVKLKEAETRVRSHQDLMRKLFRMRVNDTNWWIGLYMMKSGGHFWPTFAPYFGKYSPIVLFQSYFLLIVLLVIIKVLGVQSLTSYRPLSIYFLT